MRLDKTVGFLFWSLLGAVLLVMGLGWPAHLRSISGSAIAHAGLGSLQMEDLARILIDDGRPGPVLHLRENLVPEPIRGEARTVIADRPEWSRTGGTFPLLGSVLAPAGETVDGVRPILPGLLASGVRRQLADSLGGSERRSVQAILELRDVGGYVQFAQPRSGAGAPLDACILLTAAFLEQGFFPETTARELLHLTASALNDDLRALGRLESFFLGMVVLGSAFDAHSLALVSGQAESVRSWVRFAEFLRSNPDQESLYFSAVALGGRIDGLLNYAAFYPEDTDLALQISLSHGRGAYRFVLDQNKPLHRPPPWLATMESGVERLFPVALHSFLIERPGVAFLIKFLILFGGTFFIVCALAAVGTNRGDAGLSPPTGVEMIARRVALAILPAFVIWLIIEPQALQSIADDPGPPPILRFTSFDPFENLSSTMPSIVELDQITLLILLLFFILQLVIYIFCLIKLAEIQRQPIDPGTKLSLLDNEDQLFDLGLYVGLAGTVAALITLSIGIVETSLMMAYASTLFGILFVAFLKIMHVRPLKRRLLIEQQRGGL